MTSALAPHLRASVTDDLEALATPWRELEARHVGRSLYASHGFVFAAWQHLRAQTDRLWIVRVDDEAGRLQGVLPLWLREERRSGLSLKVLLHPGILEGERPTLLAGVAPDLVWAAIWAELLARRSEWHRLELRETDVGAFPLNAARSLSVRQGWVVQDLPDHASPYLASRSDRATTGAADAGGVPFQLQVLTSPEDMPIGWARYEALEAQMLAGEGAPVRAGTAQACDGAGALYRQWLPELARAGRVQLAFALDGQGRDLAAWLRLLEPDGAMPDRVPGVPVGGAADGRVAAGGMTAGGWMDGGGCFTCGARFSPPRGRSRPQSRSACIGRCPQRPSGAERARHPATITYAKPVA
jgi:hypothetical protein